MDLENTNSFLINEFKNYSDLKYDARNYKVKTLLSTKIKITSDMSLLKRKIVNGLEFSNDAFHELCVEHVIPQSIENDAVTLNNDDIIKYITIDTIEKEAAKLNGKYMDIFYKYGLESKNCDPQYFYTKLFYRYFLGYEYLPIEARNKQKKTKDIIGKANALEKYILDALTNVLTSHGFKCVPTSQFRNIEARVVKIKLHEALNDKDKLTINCDDVYQDLLSFSKTKENYWKPTASPKEQLRTDVCEMHSAKIVAEQTGIPQEYLYKMLNGQKPITTKNLVKIYSYIFDGNSSAYNYVYYVSGDETQREINRLYTKASELVLNKFSNIPVENLIYACLYNPIYRKTSISINDSICNNAFGIKYNYAPLLDALELLGNQFYNNKLQTGVEMTPTLIDDLLKDIKVIKKHVLAEYKDLLKASTTTYYDVSSKDGNITITRNTNLIKKIIKLI